MSYDERIKDINTIRSYLSEFFIMGFRSRDEFIQKSSRSYDNERRRIDSWLAEYYRAIYKGQQRKVFLSVDSREISFNPFYRLFKAKSFTKNDLLLHFLLLDILADGKSHSFQDIIHDIDTIYIPRMSKEVFLSEGLVRLKLNEYCSLGILNKELVQKNNYYMLSKAPTYLDNWYDAIVFFSEVNPLGVIGSYLLDSWEHNESCFSYKHHYLIGAIYSDIIFNIVSCINKGRKVRINEKRECDSSKESILFPIKIYISTQTGRQYLMVYDYEEKIFRSLRIDSILKMQEERKDLNANRIKEEFADKARFLWGVSFGDNKRLDSLRMILKVDATEAYVISRLQREKRGGTIEQLDNYRYLFSIRVYDSIELLPWIRSFIGRIEHVECSNPSFCERLYETIRYQYTVYEE